MDGLWCESLFPPSLERKVFILKGQDEHKNKDRKAKDFTANQATENKIIPHPT